MKTVDSSLHTAEMKVFLNHIYEYNKGVRSMVLCTLKKEYEQFAVNRLESRRIPYLRQEAGPRTVNLFFGREECIEAIRHFVSCPLNTLTPEEDFILGALLGYDICNSVNDFVPEENRKPDESVLYYLPLIAYLTQKKNQMSHSLIK